MLNAQQAVCKSRNTLHVAHEPIRHNAAVLIQQKWRCVKGSVRQGSINSVIDSVSKVRQRKQTLQTHIRSMCIYVVFLMCFSVHTTIEVQDQNIFYFSNNIVSRLCGSGSLTFENLKTIEDYYHWLRSYLLPKLYLTEGWVSGKSNQGFLLGNGKIVGGIRIGQVRVKPRLCGYKVPSNYVGFNFECFGDTSGD